MQPFPALRKSRSLYRRRRVDKREMRFFSALYTVATTSAQTILASDAGLTVDNANLSGDAAFGHANNAPVSAASNVTWTWTTSSTAMVGVAAFR